MTKNEKYYIPQANNVNKSSVSRRKEHRNIFVPKNKKSKNFKKERNSTLFDGGINQHKNHQKNTGDGRKSEDLTTPKIGPKNLKNLDDSDSEFYRPSDRLTKNIKHPNNKESQEDSLYHDISILENSFRVIKTGDSFYKGGRKRVGQVGGIEGDNGDFNKMEDSIQNNIMSFRHREDGKDEQRAQEPRKGNKIPARGAKHLNVLSGGEEGRTFQEESLNLNMLNFSMSNISKKETIISQMGKISSRGKRHGKNIRSIERDSICGGDGVNVLKKLQEAFDLRNRKSNT